ncbi:MAG: hypothetical protein HY319_24930 [Armatimonadetes bacterium]|nr:hypothetical protein [Armatimonadota bacterium]
MKISRAAAGHAFTGSLASIPEAEQLLQESRDEYQHSLDQGRKAVLYGKWGVRGVFAGGALALGSLALKPLSPALTLAALAVGGTVAVAGGVAWTWADMEAQELCIMLPHYQQSVQTHEKILQLVTRRVEQQLAAEHREASQAVADLTAGLHPDQARRVILKEKVVVVNGIPVPRRSNP